ncbi:hypothetical protein LJC23_00965 [Desulfovibrio sp. OttesenSCG-928-I05]|nr:hypothetical protein [Desulfovibrio sp. OttesenSCG-928-I05]
MKSVRAVCIVVALITVSMTSGCGMTAGEWGALFQALGDAGNSVGSMYNARADQYRSAANSLQSYDSGPNYFQSYPSESSGSSTRDKTVRDDYMQGHPSYNSNYYSPSYNRIDSTPNYDPDYYNRIYNYNGNYQSQ